VNLVEIALALRPLNANLVTALLNAIIVVDVLAVEKDG
jgi:hypothetical protein